ncbi:hypothetical protein [Nocardia farcinica]|nr:hypothetical protein [Nocardia farcinica]MBF6410907.1 hypothetical protein [Nocardia farcinica]UEX21189.1 hypothetical protein LMJ57_19505 [Nocardia farcinica]
MNDQWTPTLTTDPRPACGHEECQTWRDTRTGERVTVCLWADAPAEVA